MRHGVFGRKLGRNINERRLLFMNLSRALLEKGRVQTTLAKAKAVQPMVEKLITSAKAATSGARGQIKSILSDRATEERLMDMATTRFTARTSGYTRVVRLGTRRGDASEMVYLEFVDEAPAKAEDKVAKVAKGTKIREESVKIEEAELVSKEKPKRFAKNIKPVRTPRKRS